LCSLIVAAISWVELTIGLNTVWLILGWAWMEIVSKVIDAFIENTFLVSFAVVTLQDFTSVDSLSVIVELE
jgi:hypothetical protein